MKKRRSSLKGIIFLILIATLCLGISLLLVGYLEINRRTEQAFGSPKPTLDPIQRVRLSLQLLYQVDRLLEPADPGGDTVPFDIQLGESPIAIAARLESTGIIPNAGVFIKPDNTIFTSYECSNWAHIKTKSSMITYAHFVYITFFNDPNSRFFSTFFCFEMYL